MSSRSNETENPHARPPTITQGRSSQQPSTTFVDSNELSKSRSHPFAVQHAANTVVSPSLPYLSSISSTPVAHPTSLTPHLSAIPASSLLSPIPENSKPINRDSDVSLSGEAKQYIANIGSPLPSPGLIAAVSYSEPTGGQSDHGAPTGNTSWRTAPRDGDESEFLELDEEVDQLEGEEPEQQLYPSLVVNRHENVADTEDFPALSSHGTSSQSSRTLDPHSSPAPETATPSQTHWQSHSDVSVLSQSQSSAESTLTPQPDSPSPDSYLSPTKSTHGFTDVLNPTFRALPLIATDLKTTRATVSHSSIRPNDRGKDVLSFEIEVDPGKGKEPWKVEKLYSDVLGLDHRLRATVGKGVSKKIATLPEGKLWKDHAPAKSDQRKVSKTHGCYSIRP